jgi:radical SAM enzyme (TIGR01210 family)
MQRSNRSGHTRRYEQAAAVWREKELLNGKIVDAGVIILRTAGCSHFHKGGCSMCGYNVGSDPNASPMSILKQFEHGVRDVGEVQLLKIYTSGSFLDECEVPLDAAKKILHHCRDKNVKLLFESRPEYVSPERLDDLIAVHDDIEVALGLESSNDRILMYSIKKGFAAEDYEKAAKLLAEKGLDIRTYVLLKPPFITESEAIADSVSTVKFAATMSDTISLNPVNVQKGTLVEKLWRGWAYRPPWLWSVLEVLKATTALDSKILCEPTGGGKERGAHNCGECDDVILHSLKSHSLSQDPAKLGSPDCECREVWETILDVEGFVAGGTCDLQRFFRKHRA